MAKKIVNKHVELSDWVDVEVEIDDFDDEDLIEELEDRGYSVKKAEEKSIQKINRLPLIDGDTLRRMLCDICEVGYHTPTENLIKALAEKI